MAWLVTDAADYKDLSCQVSLCRDNPKCFPAAKWVMKFRLNNDNVCNLRTVNASVYGSITLLSFGHQRVAFLYTTLLIVL